MILNDCTTLEDDQSFIVHQWKKKMVLISFEGWGGRFRWLSLPNGLRRKRGWTLDRRNGSGNGSGGNGSGNGLGNGSGSGSGWRSLSY